MNDPVLRRLLALAEQHRVSFPRCFARVYRLFQAGFIGRDDYRTVRFELRQLEKAVAQ